MVRQTQTISFVFNRDKESHIMKIYKRPNNFDYDYSQKIDKGLDAPFSTNTAIAISPWAEERHIMRIGLKGFILDLNNITSRCAQGLKGNITVS
ncbi:MAG: hypothetical protein ACI9J4_000615 [Paraglaciecola sp.]